MSKSILSRTENQGAPRLGFDAYNISRERYIELRNGCATGKYSHETLSKACEGLEFVKSYILLSVTQNKSYDAFRVKWELKEMEQIPIGRSDFYGYRRKFYYNLDCLLKNKRGGSAIKERDMSK